MRVFKISESLAHKYHGAGWALAAITGGQVIDLIYLRDIFGPLGIDVDDFGRGRLAAVIDHPALGPSVRHLQALGEVSVGMCSCWEFVEQ